MDFWKIKTENTAESAARQATSNTGKTKNYEIVDETVYAEAHDIVKTWMTKKKLYGEFENRTSFLKLPHEEDEILRMKMPTKIEIHREWDHLISHLETTATFKDEVDTYIDEKDDKNDKKLQTVMKNLREKSFVDTKKLRKVDNPKPVDVSLRIQSRQEEVRKRKAEREKLEEQKKLKSLAEKEVQHEAMKYQKEEKKLKELKIKKEEELIQMEMNRVRVELQKQREIEAIERKKLRAAQEMFARQTHMSEENQKLQKQSCLIQKKIESTSEERFALIIEFINKRTANRQHQTLKQCFRAWRDVALAGQQRLETAAAWRDWLLLGRVTRAWREEARSSRLDRELTLDQTRMIQNRRREEYAASFAKKKLLKKCLLNWSLFVVDAKEARWCSKLEEMRKRKMADYIESLKEKVAENQQKLEELATHDTSQNDKHQEPSRVPHQSSFNGEGCHSHRPVPANGQERSKEVQSTRLARPQSVERPREAWQVSKQHVYMPIEKLLGHPPTRPSAEDIKSLKHPKPVNTYASRHAAQQELIEKQQQKIREQESLLEQIQCTELLGKLKDDLAERSRDLPDKHKSEDTIEEIVIESARLPDNIENLSQEKREISARKKDKFVTQMEERMKEREKMKAERMERKRQAEEEKRKRLEEEITEQNRIEAEQKSERDKMLREKRLKEKQKEEIRLKKHREEESKLNKVDEFYKKLLLKRYGVKRWSKLLTVKDENKKKATEHFEITIKRKIFFNWLQIFREEMNIQNNIVFTFYDQCILRKCFHHFKLFKHRMSLMDLRAADHHRQVMKKSCFLSWRLLNHRQQIRLDRLTVLAADFYEKCLKKRCLEVWKQIPMVTRLEKERQRRLKAMREKVSSLLPDFKTNNDDDLSTM